jgi:hypothetical protein
MAQGSSIAEARGVARVGPDGTFRWLVQGEFDEVLAVTADGRHAMAARIRATTSVELMDVPIDGSPATSLASLGINARKGMALSPDNRTIAWSGCVDVPQLTGFDDAGHLRRVVESDLPDPSSLRPVPGTPQVVVVSTRSGRPEPWLVGLSTDALPQPIPVGTLTVRDVAVSNHGARFVAATTDGLYVGSLGGVASLRRLTSDPPDAAPAFRAGDSQVVFTRAVEGVTTRIMSVPVDGGDAAALIEGGDTPAPSPVDDRLVYLAGSRQAETLPSIWDGHQPRPLSSHLPAGRYGRPSFSPDGRRIALVRGDTDVLEVDARSGAIIRTLATPTGDQLVLPTYTSAGLVAVRVRFQGNLWLADAGD